MSHSTTNLTRPVALITGAGRHRIGNAIAWDLGRAGYSVATHFHRSREDAERTIGEMHSAGIDAEPFQADVADEGEVERMVDGVVARFGRIDALVTTASIWSPKSLEETRADDLRRHFDVNVLGTFLCAQRAGLVMVDQPEGGSIVTFGDWAIERPYRDYAAYFVAKGALPTLTRTLAVELAARNPRIRVNCIHPGPVMFPPEFSADERLRVIDATLLKTADQPQAVCQAVRFLLENPLVTGAVIPVDAGRTIYAGE